MNLRLPTRLGTALAPILSAVLAAAPALAASDTLPPPTTLRAESIPSAPVLSTVTANSGAILTPQQRQTYAQLFDAIRNGRWSDAQAGLAAAGDGVLTPVARAELFLAKNSPRVESGDLVALIAVAPDLPQAPQLVLLAKKRGVTNLPVLPAPRDLEWVNGAPRRIAAKPTAGDLAASNLALQARPLLKTDKPADAETLLNRTIALLTPEAGTEWQQRIAWSYYTNNDEFGRGPNVATLAAQGPGDWSVQASWVLGLSAWRTHDCKAAEVAFTRVGANASDEEMRAAGLFWTARAQMACGRFDRVQQQLRSAARNPETFYGLIASRLLGIAVPASATAPKLTPAEWTQLSAHPDVRRAAALAEIGEIWPRRRDAALAGAHRRRARSQAAAPPRRPARSARDADLARAQPARRRGDGGQRPLPRAQLGAAGWLAGRQGAGLRPHAAGIALPHRCCQPRWRARLMQVLPTTADLVDRKRGGMVADHGALASPQVNMAYGQAYLEQLRDAAGTGGLLPKVIAAYNAGPNAVARWNLTSRADTDPLLYIESIPYAETRGYVTTVLRNYWIYQRQSGEKTSSLKALAQGAWPPFPGFGVAARPTFVTANPALRRTN